MDKDKVDKDKVDKDKVDKDKMDKVKVLRITFISSKSGYGKYEKRGSKQNTYFQLPNAKPGQ